MTDTATVRPAPSGVMPLSAYTVPVHGKDQLTLWPLLTQPVAQRMTAALPFWPSFTSR